MANENEKLSLAITQAKIVREAHENGKLTLNQKEIWLRQLRLPKTFWQWLTG